MRKWRAIWMAQRREDQVAIRKVTVEFNAEDYIAAIIITECLAVNDISSGMRLDELVEMA